jgi:hypothetical protein
VNQVPHILRRVTAQAGNSSSKLPGSSTVTGVTVHGTQVPLTKIGGSQNVPAGIGSIQVAPPRAGPDPGRTLCGMESSDGGRGAEEEGSSSAPESFGKARVDDDSTAKVCCTASAEPCDLSGPGRTRLPGTLTRSVKPYPGRGFAADYFLLSPSSVRRAG